MGVLDTYFRAFKELRKETVGNHQCDRDRNELISANPESDVFNTTKYLCHVDEEWINAIEEGLVFVEKAVQEERQFIRAEGEVVPIEKVKHISKDSVEHLAKHSEMITHIPEKESNPITPDKLYMVEKLSDYAVYENRFLYMLLCYLRDFIQFRIEKIELLRRTYISNLSVSKKIENKKRTFTLETKIYDKRTDNPYPIADEKSAKTVQRILDCQSLVNALLKTDLMQQVSQAPMVKPPIVKTNVLKMNNNFKHALALYDYISSYNGPGFTYEEVNANFAPYSAKLADELAEAFHLVSFVSYVTGNDIEKSLETSYDEEEKRRKDEETKKLVDRLNRMKKRIKESNSTFEEYMLLLEERNRSLERDSEALAVVRHEITELNRTIDGLVAEKKELDRRYTEVEKKLADKEKELAELNQRYIADTSQLKREHEQAISSLTADCQARIESCQIEFANKIQATISEHEQRMAELEAEKQNIIAEKQTVEFERNRVAADYQNKERTLEEKYTRDCAAMEAKTKSEIDEVKKKMAFVQAQLDGIRAQQGKLTPTKDYASRERFIELQEEFLAFEKFFESQWKITKKEIRKQVFWKKPEKKKSKAKQKEADSQTPPAAQPAQTNQPPQQPPTGGQS